MMTFDFEEKVLSQETLPQGTVIESDVIVVGTGAGGAVVARELAAGGMKVVMLEEGSYFSARDYGRRTVVESIRMLYRKAGFTPTFGNVPVVVVTGRCVGGTTVINSGTSLRPAASAVDRWRSEFGLRDLTDHLDVYARRVEGFLGIKPVPVLNRENELVQEGARKLGWHGEVLTRNEKSCQGAGRCYAGCPNDAKQAMNVSYVPDALRRGAMLYTEARVTRILSEAGRVRGVMTSRATFRAPTVVVAGGALFTPQLLRKPGRHLIVHPGVRVVGIFDEEVWHWKVVPQAYHVAELLNDGI